MGLICKHEYLLNNLIVFLVYELWYLSVVYYVTIFILELPHTLELSFLFFKDGHPIITVYWFPVQRLRHNRKLDLFQMHRKKRVYMYAFGRLWFKKMHVLFICMQSNIFMHLKHRLSFISKNLLYSSGFQSIKAAFLVITVTIILYKIIFYRYPVGFLLGNQIAECLMKCRNPF